MGGNVEYPLLDALGSVRQLTSNTGVNLLKRSYTADGSIRFSSGSGISRLGFAGELQDTTTGIVYLRARHYNPALGRFLQRDSFGGFAQRPQSLNRYSYAGSNPVNYSDPSGHCFFAGIDTAICAAVAFGAAGGAGFYYGTEVAKNHYDEGQSWGSSFYKGVNWRGTAWAGAEGGMAGAVGYALAPVAVAFVGGSGLLATIGAGIFEGMGAGAISHGLLNLLRGCPWNSGLGSAALGGGIGGGIGAGLGYVARRAASQAAALARSLTTVYRFADRTNPNTLRPNLRNANRFVQKLISVAMESSVFREWRADLHMRGNTSNSPFVSVLTEPSGLAWSTDPWASTIATGSPGMVGVERAPDIGIFEVPSNMLISPRPNNTLSTIETELVFWGGRLEDFLVEWIDNPYKPH